MASTVAMLNEAARRHGTGAVEGWLQLLVPGVTVARYRQQLERTYGFESAVEAALAYSPLRAVATLRPCAGYLVEDLLALGMAPARVSRVAQSEVAPFTTEPEALGWLYLLERRASVHRTVELFLVEHLPAAGDAFRYLGAATRELSERACVLAERLARLDAAPREQQECIDAMQAAYSSARAWFAVEQARAA